MLKKTHRDIAIATAVIVNLIDLSLDSTNLINIGIVYVTSTIPD